MERQGFRAAITRDIANLCGLILICSLIAGLITPTFSLFARDLGASLMLVGALNSTVGLTTMLSSVPLGILSDVLGRRRLLLAGMLAWVLAQFSLALAPSPALLALSAVFLGLANFLTFSIGAALIGDRVTGPARSYAFGLYTTVQGIGYTLGPLLGSVLGSHYGMRVSYAAAGVLAVAGLVFGWRALPAAARATRQRTTPARSTPGQLRSVIGNPYIAIACLGSVLIFLGYSGAVSSFFPLYAHELLISEAAIGTMFALRGVASTLSRLPLGALSARRSPFAVYVGSLAVTALAMLGISGSRSDGSLLLFLVIEGAAFGGLFTVSQTFLNEHTTDANRGTAVGLFQTAAGLGGTTGALLLGFVAGRLGLAAVFTATGLAMLLGVAIMVGSYLLASRRSASEAADELGMRTRET